MALHGFRPVVLATVPIHTIVMSVDLDGRARMIRVIEYRPLSAEVIQSRVDYAKLMSRKVLPGHDTEVLCETIGGFVEPAFRVQDGYTRDRRILFHGSDLVWAIGSHAWKPTGQVEAESV